MLSAADSVQGRVITLDFYTSPYVEFSITPQVEDAHSLYLYGWYADNCNTAVVKVDFQASGLNQHTSYQGVPVRNLTTGAFNANPASGGAALPFLQMMDQGNGTFTNEMTGFGSNTVTLCVGTAANQQRYVELNHPVPISHDFRSKQMTQLKCRVTSLYDEAVTFTRLVLILRAFPKGPEYMNAFKPGPARPEMRGALSAIYA